ncbi:MAG: OmpA family protein [Treponema sp.]|nr:OmpA family protein [Treponema sp.]
MKKPVFIFAKLIFTYVLIFQFNYSFSNEMFGESFIDWTKGKFSSSISFDIEKAGISFPSGRSTADNEIKQNLPLLVKNPLLTLLVDSSNTLGDMVIRDKINFEQIVSIIDEGKHSPSFFAKGLSILKVNHNIEINEISKIMIKHKSSYAPHAPIERVSSRIYTGIIIDCRGLLNVHGEFSTDKAVPCLFPKIWDESMNLLYERNILDAKIAQKNGIVTYAYTDDEKNYSDRVGHDPLRISARKIFGVHRTDPVISKKDALKILSIKENRELLKQGKIVLLLDKEQLVHAISAPKKNEEYYVVYKDIENFYYEKKIPQVSIVDGPRGTLISVQNLQFIADSSELLPGENNRLDSIAEALKLATKDGGFTILVEGHTASVGKPSGEMNLSIERSQAIINEMIKRGLQPNLFSFRGYGGTAPIADNSTPEGREQNRRVEINIVPQQTYIQRIP